MSLTTRAGSASGRTRAVVTWVAVGLCLFYAAFAFDEAVTEVLSLAGVLDGVPGRAAPAAFVIHALAGGLTLIAGSVQLALVGQVAPRYRLVHRYLGRVYVGAAGVTSAGGLLTALAFDIGPAGRIAFGIWSVLWFATTVAAVGLARARRYAQHRAWMIRSFALALVFVLFDPVKSTLLAVGLTRPVAYPVAVAGCVALTLAGAELRLRRTARRPRAQDRR